MPDPKFKPVQIEFEKKLLEFGLSYGVNHSDIYKISSQRGGGNHIIVRLISSLPVNKQIGGSKNGNDDQVIGIFIFKFLASGLESDILVFTFQNTLKTQIEFLIIPTNELMIRLVRKYSCSVHCKSVEMVFWLMEDGVVYDTTNISPEGEWYFLSKGLNGRMADDTDKEYTMFLNNWGLLNL